MKELKIEPPEGYEVDKEHSTLECIKFKPIEQQLPKTWEEFCKTHRLKEGEAYINNSSKVSRFTTGGRDSLTDKNVLPSKKICRGNIGFVSINPTL